MDGSSSTLHQSPNDSTVSSPSNEGIEECQVVGQDLNDFGFIQDSQKVVKSKVIISPSRKGPIRPPIKVAINKPSSDATKSLWENLKSTMHALENDKSIPPHRVAEFSSELRKIDHGRSVLSSHEEKVSNKSF